MDNIVFEDHDVIACIPIYKEPLQELNQMISSFKNDCSKLKYYLFIIVDGVDDSIQSLLQLLDAPHAGFKFHSSFKCITGKVKSI